MTALNVYLICVLHWASCQCQERRLKQKTFLWWRYNWSSHSKWDCQTVATATDTWGLGMLQLGWGWSVRRKVSSRELLTRTWEEGSQRNDLRPHTATLRLAPLFPACFFYIGKFYVKIKICPSAFPWENARSGSTQTLLAQRLLVRGSKEPFQPGHT